MIFMQFPLEFRGLKKKRVTDRPTDGPTDGQTLIYRCVDASKNDENYLHRTAGSRHIGRGFSWFGTIFIKPDFRNSEDL